MIAFSCAQCGMKFEVKEEFAGRSTRCTMCKEPMTVPAPAAAAPTICVPVAANSLVGLSGGVTLSVQSGDTDDTTGPAAVKKLFEGHGESDERYEKVAEIARGGMGIVIRAVDWRIRREVALKFLLDQSNSVKMQRFIEEAQITGQLEHPNIVPIHELGIDGKQQIYFSMKMVKGRSLADVLNDLRAGKADAVRRTHSASCSMCSSMCATRWRTRTRSASCIAI